MSIAGFICITFLLLSLTGVLDAPCKKLQRPPLLLAYLALCALSLSGLQLTVPPEFKISAASLVLSILLLGLALSARRLGNMDMQALWSTFCTGLLLGVMDAYLGLRSGVVLGIFCGVWAAILFGSGFPSMLFAIVLPMLTVIFSAGTELLRTGYAACDLSAPHILDAQALAFAVSFLALIILPQKAPETQR